MSTEEKTIDEQISSLQETLKKKGMPTKRKKRAIDKKEERAAKQKRRLENKLMRVITKAGVSWASWSSLLEISDTVEGCPFPFDTACWVFNEHTKKERILFSTRIMKELPVNLLILVLRHEMLHKSMYRGTKEVGNQELLNFALDAAINKILWLSNPKQSKKLGDWLFPKGTESRHGIHAIANPGVETSDFANMPARIRTIVEYIWWVEEICTDKDGLTIDNGMSCCDHFAKHGKFGNHTVPDPMVLYNKLAALLSAQDKEEIKQMYAFMQLGDGESSDEGESEEGSGGKKSGPDHPRGGKRNRRAGDKKTRADEQQFADEVLQNIRREGSRQDGGSNYYKRGGGFSAVTDMESFFQEFIYSTKDAETEGINDFISRWETLKQIESACHSIHKTFRKESAIEPFPNELTRTGQELVVLGVSGPDLPYYFNNSSEDGGATKKVCCYFDCSPSMDGFIPYMLHVTEYIDSCEEAEIAGGQFDGKYIFSEKVKGIPQEKWADFKEGKIRGGYATSFEAVATHAIDRVENDQVDIILVFTDGYSSIPNSVIDRFNESGKKCYTIYFCHGDYEYGHSRRGRWGESARGIDSYGMTSDLDRLDGESFTIFCKNH